MSTNFETPTRNPKTFGRSQTYHAGQLGAVSTPPRPRSTSPTSYTTKLQKHFFRRSRFGSLSLRNGKRFFRQVQTLRFKQLMGMLTRQIKINSFELVKAGAAVSVGFQIVWSIESYELISPDVGLTARMVVALVFVIYVCYSLLPPLARNVATYLTKGEEIGLDMISSGAETRTVVIIRNIPNRLIVEELVETFRSQNCAFFKYCYLPIDPKRRSNLGYAFVRFHAVHDIPIFYNKFHGFQWNTLTNSEKVSQVIFSKHQNNLDSVETGLRNLVSAPGASWSERNAYLNGTLKATPTTPATVASNTPLSTRSQNWNGNSRGQLQRSNSRPFGTTPTHSAATMRQNFAFRRTGTSESLRSDSSSHNNQPILGRPQNNNGNISLPVGAIQSPVRRPNHKMPPRRTYTTPAGLGSNMTPQGHMQYRSRNPVFGGHNNNTPTSNYQHRPPSDSSDPRTPQTAGKGTGKSSGKGGKPMMFKRSGTNPNLGRLNSGLSSGAASRRVFSHTNPSWMRSDAVDNGDNSESPGTPPQIIRKITKSQTLDLSTISEPESDNGKSNSDCGDAPKISDIVKESKKAKENDAPSQDGDDNKTKTEDWKTVERKDSRGLRSRSSSLTDAPPTENIVAA